MKKLLPDFIKNYIKKYLWRFVFRKQIFTTGKTSNQVAVQQLQLHPELIPPLNVFTTHNEDGILQYIFSKTGTSSNFFIDIGSNDCINSNCANLAFHYNWNGIFIDGNAQLLQRGKYIYQSFFKSAAGRFQFIDAIVGPGNINQLLQGAIPPATIDLLSVDLDGNDYHIWQALKIIQPRVVVIEVQIEKGMTEFIPVYNEVFELYEKEIPKGASPLSMMHLAKSKGYELVAANREGFNLFFVRKDCLNNLQPLTPELFSKMLIR